MNLGKKIIQYVIAIILLWISFYSLFIKPSFNGTKIDKSLTEESKKYFIETCNLYNFNKCESDIPLIYYFNENDLKKISGKFLDGFYDNKGILSQEDNNKKIIYLNKKLLNKSKKKLYGILAHEYFHLLQYKYLNNNDIENILNMLKSGIDFKSEENKNCLKMIKIYDSLKNYYKNPKHLIFETLSYSLEYGVLEECEKINEYLIKIELLKN